MYDPSLIWAENTSLVVDPPASGANSFADGFGCGPAEVGIFNFLFKYLTTELADQHLTIEEFKHRIQDKVITFSASGDANQDFFRWDDGNNKLLILADRALNTTDTVSNARVSVADAVSPDDAINKRQLDAAIANVPLDVFVNGISTYNASSNILTLTLTNGNTVDLPLTQLIQDAIASVPTATKSRRGIVRQATDSEAAAGTNDNTFISPKQYKDNLPSAATVPNATTTQRGIARQATDAEAAAGTNNTAFVTPKHLADRVVEATAKGVRFRVTISPNGDNNFSSPFSADVSEIDVDILENIGMGSISTSVVATGTTSNYNSTRKNIYRVTLTFNDFSSLSAYFPNFTGGTISGNRLSVSVVNTRETDEDGDLNYFYREIYNFESIFLRKEGR